MNKKLTDKIMDLVMQMTEACLEEEKANCRANCKKRMISAEYSKRDGTLTVPVPEEECDPNYMKYMLEYLKLPATTKIIYKKD